MNDAYKYKAFISYSHADEKWARWLHRALESYKPPAHLVGTSTDMGEVPEKMAPVFRDREELASSTDLGADLTAALEASACQIVICSMSAAKSHWVNEEILAFKRLGRGNRVFSLIVDGEPYASAYADTEKYECFPQALRFKLGVDGELTDVQAEPIAADARPGKDGKNNAKIKLLAGMLGVGFDDLRQRELQRRNRRLAAISVAAVMGMVVAIGLATTAVIARNEADAQRLIAQEKAETARRTADFMIGLFEVSDPSESRGRSITAREILEKGAERIEEELAGQPVIQASMMNSMGRAFTGLGLYGKSLQLLEQALQRRRLIASTAPGEMNESLYRLANVLTLRADYDRAEKLYLEAIETLQTQEGEHAEAILDNFAGLAELYFQTGQYEQAEPILRRVLDDRRQMLDPLDPAIADAMQELGLNMLDQGRYEEAEVLIRDALEFRVEVLGSEPHPDLNNLAEVYLTNDQLEKAESMYLQALEMQRELVGDQHPQVALVWANLAYVYYYAGDLPAAREAMQKSIGIWQYTHGEEHPDIARSLSTLGRWLAEAGESAEAELVLRKALAQQEKLLESNHAHTALTRMAIADLLNRDGRAREALREATAAEQSLKLTLGEDHWYTVMAQSVYGSALAASGDEIEGEKLLLDSYQRLAADDSAVPVAVEQALLRLIEYYQASKDASRARDYLAIHQRDYVD